MIFQWKIISAERPERKRRAGPTARRPSRGQRHAHCRRGGGDGALPHAEVRIVKKIVSGSVTSEVTVLHHDG